MTRAAAAVLLVALPGCAALWPSKSAERVATVQFLAPAAGGECAVVRADGDRVTVLALTERPALARLPAFLARRGLSRVDDLVFTAAPVTAPALPDGVRWLRLHGPAAAAGDLARLAAALPAGAADVVREERVLEGPGLEVRLIPSAAGDRLLADLRHAGNRLLLVAAGPEATAAAESAAGPETVDLVGLLPSAKAAGRLTELPGFAGCTFLVRDTADGGPHDAVVGLPAGGRLLFQSDAAGLLRLGRTHDLEP